jgi:hypothetical protein
MMRTLVSFVLASAVLAALGCQTERPLHPPFDPRFTWVATDPIQCLGNPWEIEWLEEHDGDYSKYPRDKKEQLKIIDDYYERRGVKVFNTAIVNTYEVVCCACSCPAGHTVYLYVKNEDVQTMLDFGFRVEDPVY